MKVRLVLPQMEGTPFPDEGAPLLLSPGGLAVGRVTRRLSETEFVGEIDGTAMHAVSEHSMLVEPLDGASLARLLDRRGPRDG